jgi:glycosyltransferase involved in cell wall biosynthesis
MLDWVCDPARPGTTGLSDIVWELGNQLDAMGDQVSVVGAYRRDAPSPTGGARLYRVDRPDLWHRNIVGMALTCLSLARAVGRIPRPDVVFAPEYLSTSLTAALHPRLPVAFTTPGNIYERIAHGNPYDWTTTPVYKMAARTAARRCARVIALSRHMEEWWLRTGAPRERVVVIPLGFDPELFHPSPGARERLGIPADEETILYAGRFSVEKNLAVLIDAVARLAPERPRLRLRLIGSGPEEAALRARVGERDVEAAVLFGPWVPREVVPDYYRAADVVVLPSTSEPLARAQIEAMACGALLVASNRGGAPDLIEHGVNGVLVEPHEVDAWQRWLRQSFEESAWRASLAERGRATAHGQLTWPKIARRIRDEALAPSVRAWARTSR